MINKLPSTIILPENDQRETVKQLYRIFIDNNKKINEIINHLNGKYPEGIMFRKNGTDLECSLDGGATWKIVTLT